MIFGFQSNQLVEDFECSVDGEQFSGCEAVARARPASTAGQHTIEVRALRFISEIVDPTPASYTWTVVGEPETTILSGPPAISGRASATFTFRSDQPNVDVLLLGRRLDARPVHLAVHRRAAGPGRPRVRGLRRQRVLLPRRRAGPGPGLRPIWEWEVQDVTPPDTTHRVGDVARPDRPHRARQHPLRARRHRQRDRLVRARVRVLARRRPVGRLRLAVPLPAARGAARRRPRAARPRHGRVRERRPDAGQLPVHDRGRPGDDDPHRAGAGDRRAPRRRSPSPPTRPPAPPSSARSTWRCSSPAPTRSS